MLAVAKDPLLGLSALSSIQTLATPALGERNPFLASVGTCIHVCIHVAHINENEWGAGGTSGGTSTLQRQRQMDL